MISCNVPPGFGGRGGGGGGGGGGGPKFPLLEYWSTKPKNMC